MQHSAWQRTDWGELGKLGLNCEGHSLVTAKGWDCMVAWPYGGTVQKKTTAWVLHTILICNHATRATASMHGVALCASMHPCYMRDGHGTHVWVLPTSPPHFYCSSSPGTRCLSLPLTTSRPAMHGGTGPALRCMEVHGRHCDARRHMVGTAM